jgi:hypothetical protein
MASSVAFSFRVVPNHLYPIWIYFKAKDRSWLGEAVTFLCCVAILLAINIISFSSVIETLILLGVISFIALSLKTKGYEIRWRQNPWWNGFCLISSIVGLIPMLLAFDLIKN